MGCALSSDLRKRVLRAWQDGSSARQAAARFGVSVLPSRPLPVPGLGRARWLVELIRCRAGESADLKWRRVSTPPVKAVLLA